MYSTSPWMPFPVPSTPESPTSFQHANYEIYLGNDSQINGPLLKDSQTTVVLKNLPPKVTKEIIEDLLKSKPLQIRSPAIMSVELLRVIDGKASCKIKFDLDLNASLVNSINTWYLRINKTRDDLHESKILVEYPEYPDCNEASLLKLNEDLSNESTFSDALDTLKHWLSRGEVTKRNANNFFNLLYKIYERVAPLNGEKMKSDSELREAKQDLKTKVEGLSESLKGFQSVLQNASLKKVWDHFTKYQRRNLDGWKSEVEELEKEYSRELLSQREEEEMEICDGEKESAEISDTNTKTLLKEQLDSLLHQKAALTVELIEAEKEKDKEIAQKQKALYEASREVSELQAKIEEIKEDLANGRVKETDNTAVTVRDSTTNHLETEASEAQLSLSWQQVYQLGMLTLFLKLHENGASTDYLTLFLNDCGQSVTNDDFEVFMMRFPNLFTYERRGEGPDVKLVWKYVWPVCE